MLITRVSYSRLVSLDNYENEKIGATADVEPGEDSIAALSALKDWVNTRITGRLQDRQSQELLGQATHELKMVNQRIDHAVRKYAKLKEILASHGVDLNDLQAYEDLPF